MKGLLSTRFLTLGISLVLTVMLSACGGSSGGGGGGGSAPGGGGTPTSGVTLDILQEPEVAWLSTTGRTKVVLQFTAHDTNGRPLTEDEVEVELEVDGSPVDVESRLDQSSEELEVNLYLGLVLDASFSMLQYTPSAFDEMISAAQNIFEEMLELWDARQGEVKVSVLWFNDFMNQSVTNAGVGRDWEPDDIMTIPEPVAGEGTKLIAAVKTMADFLKSEYDNGEFDGDRDQYVMLSITDGAENQSFFDNSDYSLDLTTTSGASYRQFGTAPVTPEDAAAAVTAHDKLTSHVLGVGTETEQQRDLLQMFVTPDIGVFETNLSSASIGELFSQVLRRFTTIQTQGAAIPLPPGDYSFTLRVRNRSGGEPGRYTFTMHAGEPSAAFISAP